MSNEIEQFKEKDFKDRCYYCNGKKIKRDYQDAHVLINGKLYELWKCFDCGKEFGVKRNE